MKDEKVNKLFKRVLSMPTFKVSCDKKRYEFARIVHF